jgi:DNA polymerase elongation subunit (family B)
MFTTSSSSSSPTKPLLFQLYSAHPCQSPSNQHCTSLLLFGREAPPRSRSVALQVHGVFPFFYVPALPGAIDPRETIDTFFGYKVVQSTTLVERIDVHGWQLARKFWLIELKTHYSVKRLRDAINEGRVRLGFDRRDSPESRRCYLTDFPYELLSQCKLHIEMSKWVEVKADDFFLTPASSRVTVDPTYEFTILDPESVRAANPDLNTSLPTQMRIMSFDIECAGRPRIFPQPEHDPVIQIGYIVRRLDENDGVDDYRIVTWKPATPFTHELEGPHLFRGDLPQPVHPIYDEQPNELAMLQRFFELKRQLDVDIFTGYNVWFDLVYVFERICFLMGGAALSREHWSKLGRLTPPPEKAFESRFTSQGVISSKDTSFSSKAYGTRTQVKLSGIVGTHVIDEQTVVRREIKLRSYTLKNVAPRILTLLDEFELRLDAWMITVGAKYMRLSGLTRDANKPFYLKPSLLIPAPPSTGFVDNHLLELGDLHSGMVGSYFRLAFDKPVKSDLLFMSLVAADGVTEVAYEPLERASNTEKEDVHHSEITRLWEGSDDDRRRLAIYNLVDAYLPLLLMWRLKTLLSLVEISRACGIDVGSLVERGQGIRTTMLIQRECHEQGKIVPDFPARIKWKLAQAEPYDESLWMDHREDEVAKKAQRDAEVATNVGGESTTTSKSWAKMFAKHDDDDIAADNSGDDDDDNVEVVESSSSAVVAAAPLVTKGKGKTNFQGAIVLKLVKRPNKRGEMTAYYTTATDAPEDAEVIATLDFASLYPSIMQAENICFTTLLRTLWQIDEFKAAGFDMDRDAVQVPGLDPPVYFVRPEVRRGILPNCLEKLLSARKEARRLLAVTKDTKQKPVLEARQMQLKFTANSVYGFTGNPNGSMPEMRAGAAVTAYGRKAIMTTKELVESDAEAIAEGLEPLVVYGDTDSVFVRLRTPNMEVAMRVAKRLCEKVTLAFRERLGAAQSKYSLEFEKLLNPWLGVNQKRYAGLYWTKLDGPDKVYARGLESEQRGVCPLVNETMKSAMHLIFWENDVKRACKLVRFIVSQLWLCRVPLQKLTFTKEWSKEVYANPQPHIEVARKRRERDPTQAYALGDRIPYVVTSFNKKHQKMWQSAEDPDYCERVGMYVDQAYYVEALEGPLGRLFEPIIGETAARELFHGDHTRKRKMMTPKTNEGILAYMVAGASMGGGGGGGGGGDAGDADMVVVATHQQPKKAAALPQTSSRRPAKKAAVAVGERTASIASFFSRAK